MDYLALQMILTNARKHRGRRHFLAIFQALIIVGVMGCTAAALAQPKTTPITLNNLLRALKPAKGIRRLPVKEFVVLLDKNGVDFQLTEEDEKRIRVSGANYGPQGLDTILTAVRRNFRPALASTSPLQVQYRLVAGNSIDFFLRKSSKKDWEMLDIGGNVSIIPNNTYQTLSQLARTFSVPFVMNYFNTRNVDRSTQESEVRDSPNTPEAASYQERQGVIFVGSGGAAEFPTIYSHLPNLIKSLENPVKPWRINLSRKLDDDFGSPIIRMRDIVSIRDFCFVLTGGEYQPRRYREDQSVKKVTSYLRDQFSSSTKALLQNCSVLRDSRWGSRTVPTPELKPLIDDLNKILRGPSLYHQEAFREQNHLPTTLPNQIPTGEELVRLNRTFLVEIYRDFILKEHESNFVFLKELQREDFAELDTLGRFYDQITQSYLPSSFGYMEVTTKYEGGCGDSQPFDSARIVAPYMALWIAVFENVSDKRIRLGNFALKENVSNKLRTREEDASVLSEQAVRQVPLYPLGVLKPNEKIIVPLELVLMYSDDIKQLPGFDPNEVGEPHEPVITSTQLTTVEQEKPFRRTPQISLVSGRINTTRLLDILRRPPLTFASQQKYVYGPSVKIENVEVNEARYQVRAFNPDKPLITSSGYIGASCPFIYTYDETKKSWVNEGVVMAGFDAKIKESTDVKLLHRFDGRIIVEEREAEDSFIDFLQVRARTIDGKEIVLHPKNKLLRTIDGCYLMLRQGERLVVDFDIPKGMRAMEYSLEVSGYYVPYESNQPKRIQ